MGTPQTSIASSSVSNSASRTPLRQVLKPSIQGHDISLTQLDELLTISLYRLPIGSRRARQLRSLQMHVRQQFPCDRSIGVRTGR